MDVDALLFQGRCLVLARFAVDVPRGLFAVMNAPRLLGEIDADVVAVVFDVAPQVLVEPLRSFSQFLGSGAIMVEDAESSVTDNWPPAVQRAIGEIRAFNKASC